MQICYATARTYIGNAAVTYELNLFLASAAPLGKSLQKATQCSQDGIDLSSYSMHAGHDMPCLIMTDSLEQAAERYTPVAIHRLLGLIGLLLLRQVGTLQLPAAFPAPPPLALESLRTAFDSRQQAPQTVRQRRTDGRLLLLTNVGSCSAQHARREMIIHSQDSMAPPGMTAAAADARAWE